MLFMLHVQKALAMPSTPTILYIYSNVSCEFDDFFRVDTHLCKLCTTVIARFINSKFHEPEPNIDDIVLHYLSCMAKCQIGRA